MDPSKKQFVIFYIVSYSIAFIIKKEIEKIIINNSINEIEDANTNQNVIYSNILFTIISSIILFSISFYHNCTNFIDFAWATLPLALIFNSFFTIYTFHYDRFLKIFKEDNFMSLNGNYFNSKIILTALMLTSILIYCSRHILLVLSNYKGLNEGVEDFRYTGIRKMRKNKCKNIIV